VLACRETIGRWAERVATKKGESAVDVASRITSGLHEGIEPVPAMIAAAMVAQERAAKYIALA